jgi:hypothetical protein
VPERAETNEGAIKCVNRIGFYSLKFGLGIHHLRKYILQRRGGVANYVDGIQNQRNFKFCFASRPWWRCRVHTQIVNSENPHFHHYRYNLAHLFEQFSLIFKILTLICIIKSQSYTFKLDFDYAR